MARFLSRTRGGVPSVDGDGSDGGRGVGNALRNVSLGVVLGAVLAGVVIRRYRSRGESSTSRPEGTEASGSSVYVWRPTREDLSPSL